MKKVLLGVVLFMALPVFAEEAVSSKFLGTFWALVPPLVAITLALITKEVFLSLFAGIVLGGLFVGNFVPLQSMDAIVKNGFIEAVKGTSGVFVFLVILGIIVALINRTGAAAAFGKWAKNISKVVVVRCWQLLSWGF